MDESTNIMTRVKEHYDKYIPESYAAREMPIQVSRWEKTGLLAGLDTYPASQIAMLLENQRIMQDMSLGSTNTTGFPDQMYRMFKRTSLACVRRIYDPRFFIGFDLVSFQCLMSPAGLVYFQKMTFKDLPVDNPTPDEQIMQQNGIKKAPDASMAWVMDNEDWVAKTRKLRTTFNYQPPATKSKNELLDYEAELTGQVAWDITQDINREILTDIRNNAGTYSVVEYTNPHDIRIKIAEMSRFIEMKILSRPNWLVTNPQISALLRQRQDQHFVEADNIATWNGSTLGVTKIGKLTMYSVPGFKDVTIYEDPLFPNTVLLGYRNVDNPYHAGYFYGAYVPLSATGVVFDPNCNPRLGLMKRYAKKLLRFGAKFYGRITVNGLPQE